MTSATVCVVVKDRRELMMRCLAAIEAQDLPVDEIVVVDNESSDGTYEALLARAERSARLRVRRCGGSLGRVRNVAARVATTEVCAFTDSDCRPRPDWLRRGLAGFANPRVGVVQGATVPEHPPRERWSATQQIDRPSGLYEACNVFYRRAALLAAGGFDERLGFFGEDTAAGWAVLHAGWEAAWVGAAVVEHVVSTPGLRWHLRRARGYANWPALIQRFPEQRSLLWHRYFLRQRSAETQAALLGTAIALGCRQPWPLAAAAPFAWRHRVRGLSRQAVGDAAGSAAFDAAIAAALIRGSLRHRTVVL